MSKKKKIEEFYYNYEGDKVSFGIFLNRCYREPFTPMDILIQEKLKKQYTGKRKDLIERFNKQKKVGLPWETFTGRLHLGYTKEEAILPQDKFNEIAKIRKKERAEQKRKEVVECCLKSFTDADDIYNIKVTYPKDVANVFRKYYNKLIDCLLDKIDLIDEGNINELPILNNRLKELEEELNVFNLYNPI